MILHGVAGSPGPYPREQTRGIHWTWDPTGIIAMQTHTVQLDCMQGIYNIVIIIIVFFFLIQQSLKEKFSAFRYKRFLVKMAIK